MYVLLYILVFRFLKVFTLVSLLVLLCCVKSEGIQRESLECNHERGADADKKPSHGSGVNSLMTLRRLFEGPYGGPAITQSGIAENSNGIDTSPFFSVNTFAPTFKQV